MRSRRGPASRTRGEVELRSEQFLRFRRDQFVRDSGKILWVARASRALVSASRRNRLSKVRDRGTRSPTRETRALPRQQIRAVFFCSLQCLLLPPRCDLSMISGKQHIWHFPATKLSGPRVLRAFQDSAAETVVRG